LVTLSQTDELNLRSSSPIANNKRYIRKRCRFHSSNFRS